MNTVLFWRKVVRRPDGHWIWIGACHTGTRLRGGRYNSQPAHRVAYALIAGPIPPGQELHPVCAVPNCVRPDPAHNRLLPRGSGVKHRLLGNRFAARLTPTQVRELRSFAAQGVPVPVLAARYRIARSTADNCIARRSYRGAED